MSTAISWTNETWNPVVGCTQVSDGCDNCYANTLHTMRHEAHLRGKRMLPQYHVPFTTVQLMHERLIQPVRWGLPRRVFVNSVSDLFHKNVTLDFLDKCFAVMAFARRHTFQILTKRPHRMRSYMKAWAGVRDDRGLQDRWDDARAWLMGAMPGRGRRLDARREYVGVMMANITPDQLPNVWLGTSIEHQAAADKRIPMLLDTPAAVRFLSCEPLLGPVDLNPFAPFIAHLGAVPIKCRHGRDACPECDRGIDWVIVGGESGAKRRDMELSWMRTIVEQCVQCFVPVFVKQDSALKSEQRGRIPDDLWIREFPQAVAL